MNIREFNKIVIFGASGSGKSYVSLRIAELTKYPVLHLDAVYWLRRWEAIPENEFVARQREVISGDAWIIEGNYKDSMEMRFIAADLVIFLEVNRFTRILSGALREYKKRPYLPPELELQGMSFKEHMNFAKSQWAHGERTRINVMELYDKYPSKPFLHIKGRYGMKKLLNRWETA